MEYIENKIIKGIGELKNSTNGIILNDLQDWNEYKHFPKTNELLKKYENKDEYYGKIVVPLEDKSKNIRVCTMIHPTNIFYTGTYSIYKTCVRKLMKYAKDNNYNIHISEAFDDFEEDNFLRFLVYECLKNDVKLIVYDMNSIRIKDFCDDYSDDSNMADDIADEWGALDYIDSLC